MNVTDIGKNAKAASIKLRSAGAETRNKALRSLASALLENVDNILEANRKDCDAAHEQGVSSALQDRLYLNEKRIQAMAEGVLSIVKQEEVVGQIDSEFTRDDGLIIRRESIPLGVVCMIFESRPNVVIDCSALAIKSANAIILKGGKEAQHSNAILGDIVQHSIQAHIPKFSVQVVDSTDRDTTNGLLTLNEYVNVVIPRGGEGLIEHVYKTSTVPVIAHFKGLCHIYVHDDADLEQARNIIINAKTQRPGVCNALETLLIHEHIAPALLADVVERLESDGVELRGDTQARSMSKTLTEANSEDWDTEYLDKILSIKIVSGVDEAIAHIQQHGTLHTESILAKDQNTIEKFCAGVDASCVAVNASTRFNDGGELGLGAELGISTTKFHAYGPMGARELTTQRFLVVGTGHVRA